MQDYSPNTIAEWSQRIMPRPIYLEKDLLNRLYLEENKSQAEIAKLVNRNVSSVCRALRKFQITKSQSMVLSRYRENCLEKFGVDNPQKDPAIHARSQAAIFNKYGTENVLCIPSIKARYKTTCQERYGCDNVMKNPSIARRALGHMFRTKSYQTPSGCTWKIMGTENFALDFLFDSGVLEKDISISAVPVVKWQDTEGKNHSHYPDIFLLKENRIIESKSPYTKDHTIGLLEKKVAAIEQGFGYEIWVFGKKGNLLEVL